MLFDIAKFDSYKEDNRREVKKARGGLPVSLWETYSSFANSSGGVIILGAVENEDHTWRASGLNIHDEEKLVRDFWDTIHNRSKVSVNLLSESSVEVQELGENVVIVIYVPRAGRSQKPVYINGDLFGGSFRRDHDGDYHCTAEEVKAMLRDQPEDTADMKVLDQLPLDVFNHETIEGYRNRHRTLKPAHPFGRLDDAEFLRSIGAAAVSDADHQLHPTSAGILMFGNEYDIVRQFPEYFLDYREMLDPSIRWTDRLQSSSGDWSGNLFDFYFRVYNKIIRSLKIPFRMNGGDRIDDTPVHQAIREALANCLVNADYYGTGGIIIRLEPSRLILENPGYIRTGKEQMLRGGISDPRNKGIMKMFNLISIGERAGSGVPNILAVWKDEGWNTPQIEESFHPDRTVLTLEFEGNVPKNVDGRNDSTDGREKKITAKTRNYMSAILNFMQSGVWYRASELTGVVPVGERRIKYLLSEMTEMKLLEESGTTKGKKYRKNT